MDIQGISNKILNATGLQPINVEPIQNTYDSEPESPKWSRT